MGDYIEPEELAARYRIFDTASMTNVASDFIYYAERDVEAQLAPAYTVPFSAAHPTIKDLCIDSAYVRWARMNKPKDAKLLDDALQKRFENIRLGNMPIITGSGSLEASFTGEDLPASTTEDYHPVHSMLGAESEYTMVSSERLDALEDARD